VTGSSRRPVHWAPAVGCTLITTMLAVVSCVVQPALFFVGDAAAYYPVGVGACLLSTAIVAVVVALTSRYAGAVAKSQEESAVVLALIVQAIMPALAARGAGDEILPTLLAAIAVASVATGLACILLGLLRGGDLVRFLPFPVIAGFLAGVGWLLVGGAISASGVPVEAGNLRALLHAGAWLRWLPGLALGGVLLWRQHVNNHYLNMPVVLSLGAMAFWLVAAALGLGPEELRAGGWLLGPFPSGSLLEPLRLGASLDHVAWGVLAEQLPEFATLVFVSVVTLLLSISSLEVVVAQDLDFDRELRWHGVANMLAGLVAGPPGFTSVSSSALSYRLGAPVRLVGIGTALGCLGALFVGAQFLGFVPRLVAVAILFYVGLDFLGDWLVRTRRRMPFGDYAVLLLVFAVTVLVDFVWAVVVGLGAGLVIFVLRYSRISAVRSAHSGAGAGSHVERPPAQRALLAAHEEELLILVLQGFLFFGTANGLLERIRSRFEAAQGVPLRWLILDFDLVSGLDSSAAASFTKLRQSAEREGFTILLAGGDARTLAPLIEDRSGAADARPVHRFPDLDRALEWAENGILAEAPPSPGLAGQSTMPFGQLFTTAADQDAVLAVLDRLDCAAGGELIEQGDRSDALLYIAAGRVEVQLELPDGRVIRVRAYEAGTLVGEIAFYTGAVRSASVVAVEPTVAWRLTRGGLDRLAELRPDLVARLHGEMARLLADRLSHTSRLLGAGGR
jgi:sulfate permease, SulP family